MGSIPGQGRSPGGGHSNLLSILAWRIPWTEKPGGLQSTGSQRVRHNCTCRHIKSFFYLEAFMIFLKSLEFLVYQNMPRNVSFLIKTIWNSTSQFSLPVFSSRKFFSLGLIIPFFFLLILLFLFIPLRNAYYSYIGSSGPNFLISYHFSNDLPLFHFCSMF